MTAKNGQLIRWRVRGLGAALVASVMLAGCGSGGFRGVYNLPLPGGANLGSHPYQVSAQFSDVLDLVPQSGVKVDNVAVGRVTKILLEPDGRLADVTMKVNGDVKLPANAVATISQTSLLGEKYVELAAPTGVPAVGTLADGARIGTGSTTQAVQIEQVFGALSLLLNGGGVAQLQQITTELNKATAGHEQDLRTVLASADQVVGQLNAHRDSITRALDGLSSLSKTLNVNQGRITHVLNDFSPGLQVLAEQRGQLVAMLRALDQLSGVTVHLVNASQADLIGDLHQLQPILQQLAAAGSALPQSLQILLTYPFPDSVLPGIRGDYLNAFVTTNLRTTGGTVVQAQNWPSLAASGPSATAGSNAGRPARATGSVSSTPGTISPPPMLLPSTSSVAAGVSSSAITTGSPSSSGTGSPSSTGSPSGTGSAGSTGTPGTSGSATGSTGSPTAGGSSSSGSGSSSAAAGTGGH